MPPTAPPPAPPHVRPPATCSTWSSGRWTSTCWVCRSDLNKVVLKIVAVSGAGNLLGNLLCAVVGLLDGGGLLAEVSNILNSILAILRL